MHTAGVFQNFLKRNSDVIFSHFLACGNNLTSNIDVDSNTQWPSLAVAFNEISNVHCTATIGTYLIVEYIIEKKLSEFF